MKNNEPMNTLPDPASQTKLSSIRFKMDGIDFEYDLTARWLEFGRNYSTMSFHTFTKVVDYVNAFLKKHNS